MRVGCIPTHLQFPSLTFSLYLQKSAPSFVSFPCISSLYQKSRATALLGGIHKKWRMIGIYMRWSEAAQPLPPLQPPLPPPPLLSTPSTQGKTKTCSAYKICLNLGRREVRARAALTRSCMICTSLSFHHHHHRLNLRTRLCNKYNSSSSSRSRRLSPRRAHLSHPSLFLEDYQICLPPTKSSNHTFLLLLQSFTPRNNLSL